LKQGQQVIELQLDFWEKIQKFKKDNPVAPSSLHARASQYLSLDCFFNQKLIKSICTNFSKSKVLTELNICGMNLSKESCEILSQGLLTAKFLTKLNLNFCLPKRDCLLALMPALCSPDIVPIAELSLAANGLIDDECGELIAKIVIHH
jgi:hypothetical protein